MNKNTAGRGAEGTRSCQRQANPPGTAGEETSTSHTAQSAGRFPVGLSDLLDDKDGRNFRLNTARPRFGMRQTRPAAKCNGYRRDSKILGEAPRGRSSQSFLDARRFHTDGKPCPVLNTG